MEIRLYLSWVGQTLDQKEAQRTSVAGHINTGSLGFFRDIYADGICASTMLAREAFDSPSHEARIPAAVMRQRLTTVTAPAERWPPPASAPPMTVEMALQGRCLPNSQESFWAINNLRQFVALAEKQELESGFPCSVRVEFDPPVAIRVMVHGQDARSCPACGRTFEMKPGLEGKIIRCRGCKKPFRIAETQVTAQGRPQANMIQKPLHGYTVPPKPSDNKPTQERRNAARKRLLEEMDVSDLLATHTPDGQAPPPENAPANPVNSATPAESARVQVLAMILSGLIAATLTIAVLWYGFGSDPFNLFKAPPPPEAVDLAPPPTATEPAPDQE